MPIIERQDGFEVRVLKGKSGWTVLSTWDNSEDAAQEGREIIDSGRYLGVKVVHEMFDPDRGRHRESTLLEHYKPQIKLLAMAGVNLDEIGRRRAVPLVANFDDDEFDDEVDDELNTDRRAKMVAIVLCAFIVLTVGVGIMIGTGGMSIDGANIRGQDRASRTTTYDLPALTMNVTTPEGQAAVRISLSLEIGQKQNVSAIEASLSGIMASVFDSLEGADARILNDREALTSLRDRLHHAIQSAAGKQQIYGVLFKDIRPL